MPERRKPDSKSKIKDFLDRTKIIKQRPPKDPLNPDKEMQPPKLNEGGALRRAAKKKRLKELRKQNMPILEPETQEMIEAFENDRSPKFDPEMFEQSPAMGGDVPKMNKGGSMTCPNRPDGVRGGGAAIAGMKFTGVK